MDRPSTGIDALDELLGRLGVGDNVVWQAPDPADIEPFVEAFLATAHGDTPLTISASACHRPRSWIASARCGTATVSLSWTAGRASQHASSNHR